MWVAIALASSRASAQSEPATRGRVVGVVLDAKTGAPVADATVILRHPTGTDGEPRQQLTLGGADGSFAFADVPSGRYVIEFSQVGYRADSVADFEVVASRDNRAELRIAERAGESADSEPGAPPPGVEELTIHGDQSRELLSSVQRRTQSDEMLNVLGAADLSKFAAVDMGDALKRVAGVNVVEGQFAIIRGLEDRYSSTLYNGAPVPSPDPERQSPQLDLFPSKIVDQTVVSKNFAPALPSNSAGGSIDILTPSHPEDQLEISLRAKGGLNENAYEHFYEFQSRNPVGNEQSGLGALSSEYGADVRGHTTFLERELRFKALANWEATNQSDFGWKEGRQPAKAQASRHFPAGDLAFGELSLTDGRFDETTSTHNEQITVYGDVGFDLDDLGDHTITASTFYTQKDTEKVRFREDGYLPGFDYQVPLDLFIAGEDVNPGVFIGTGQFTPGKNGSPRAWIGTKVANNPTLVNTPPPFSGHSWFANFYESRSYDISRDLQIYQLNGDHILDQLVDGLHASWATNYATTTQDEKVLDARIAYEGCGIFSSNILACPTGVTPITQDPSRIPVSFPHSTNAIGPGQFIARKGLFASFNDIDEDQYFARMDAEYAVEPLSWLGGELRSGLWYEHAERDVDSEFLLGEGLTANCPEAAGCIGSSNYAIWGNTLTQLGGRIFNTALLRNPDGTLANILTTKSEAEREIQALHIDGKATFWDDFDVLGGVRIEQIQIESKNDPFQPNTASFDGSGQLIFPSKYLFFDRLDNPARNEGLRRPPPYNDQILGIDVPVGPCRDADGNVIPEGQPNSGQCVDLINADEIRKLINGEIDETQVLPAAALNYRAFRWLTLRGAYSQSVARPSFREMAYYVSVASSAKTDDLTIGNPQLELSEVESWDLRGELVWGNFSDLFAVSLFQKKIEKPIEQIVLRDPSVFETRSDDTFRTFFNNPSDGRIRGIEVEARKSLTLSTFDFLDVEIPGRENFEFLDYLSIGGNYSYFNAEVHRSAAELARSAEYFGDTDGNPQGLNNPAGPTPYGGLHRKRRLYGQPKWIANADITFDHPIWGTQVTLAWFAISDVLDAAGVATPNQAGQITQFTLDRYIDSYGQLDLVVSQKLWQGFSVKVSAKNLTDSTRRIVYDPAQTSHKIAEREYKRGRDYSLQLIWKF